MSLKLKIALLTLFTALVVGIASATWSVQRMRGVLIQERIERGVSINNALAETLMSQVTVRDQVGIAHGLQRLKKSSHDIDYVYVIDFDGKLFGHTFKDGFPDTLPISHQVLQVGQTNSHRNLVIEGKEILEVTTPLVDGLAARVTIGMDAGFLHEQLGRMGLLILGVSLGIGVLVSLVISYIGRRVISPLEGLASQMSRYGRGEIVLPEVVGMLGGSSEIEVLSQRFADMIRDRQLVEAELNQFKDTLDNTLDAVFMFDPDDLQFIYVNRGSMLQLGYSRKELTHMGPVDIKPQFDEQDFRKILAPLLSGELDSLTFETIHRSKDKQDIPVEIFLQYMSDSDPGRFLAIVRDISERKRTEAELQKLNYELEQRVETRTAELANTNEQLRETLGTLQQAQVELVRSEKLASLGSLVAGVAHELNTPLGNSVTLSTSIRDWQKKFIREMDEGKLRKSSLTDFLHNSEEAVNLLIRNLMRAAELISDFKQVAVDQTSAQRREFDLLRVITEVIETLQPQFKKTRHQINVDVPEGIHMDSYPGPLGQVITNLSLNALIHGFSDSDNGLVEIKGRILPNYIIELVVSDNGSGIPEDYISKVFDPFFTTKLGKGGSGLGLHIVYTLVTRVLGGTISVDRSTSGGASLIMQLPIRAPDAQPVVASSA